MRDAIKGQQNIGKQNFVDGGLSITNLRKKIKETFSGSLNDNWIVTKNSGNAMAAPALASGILTLSTGTTAGDWYELISRETFVVPFRVQFACQTPVRVANTHYIVELVSVDESQAEGDINSNPNYQAPNELSRAAWNFGGTISTTATNAVYESCNSGLAPTVSSLQTLGISIASLYGIFELEAKSEETLFALRQANTGGGKINEFVSHSASVDPWSTYKIRIRIANLAAWKPVTNGISGTGGVIQLTVTAHGYATSNKVWVDGLSAAPTGFPSNGGYGGSIIGGQSGARGIYDGNNLGNAQGVNVVQSAVRGIYTVTVVDANTIELQGTSFHGSYIAGTGRVALAAAPASNQAFKLAFVDVVDYFDAISEGRGGLLAEESLPVLSQASQINQSYNDSTTNLGISATFTGTSRDFGAVTGLQNFKTFSAVAFSDQASAATNGFRIEASNDNTTWRTVAQTALVANTPSVLSVPITTRYYRVVVVNGGVAQTQFLLTSSASKL